MKITLKMVINMCRGLLCSLLEFSKVMQSRLIQKIYILAGYAKNILVISPYGT